MVYVGVSEPDEGSRDRKVEEVSVNFDSDRRKRRFERAKKARDRNYRYVSFKAAKERQKRLDRLVTMGVIG